MADALGVALALVVLLVAVDHVRSSGPGPRDRTTVIETALRYVAAVNAHDAIALQEITRSDLAFHDTASGATQGHTGFLTWAHLLDEAYPTFGIAVDDITVDGVRATVRYRTVDAPERSTHAIARDTRVSLQLVLQVDGGRIAEIWSNYGEFGLHQDVAGPADAATGS